MKITDELRFLVRVRKVSRSAFGIIPLRGMSNSSRFPKMSWSFLFGASGVGLAFLAALCALIGWFISWQEGRTKDAAAAQLADQNREKFIVLETRLADSKAAQAKAEVLLAGVEKALKPRYLALGFDQATGSFKTALAGKPTGEAEILYSADDEESYLFAVMISANLSDTGWNVTKTRTMTENDILPQESGTGDKGIPLHFRVGGHMTTINLVSLHGATNHLRSPAYTGLEEALTHCGYSVGLEDNVNLSPNLIRIVISKRP